MTHPGDADRLELLAQTREMLDETWGHWTKLMQVLHEMQGGFGSGGGGGARGGDRPDPTAAAATRNDPARRALSDIDRLVRRLNADARSLRAHQIHWLTTERGSPTGEGEPGCEVIAFAGGWEPVYRESDVAGVLPRRYRLGRWAFDFVTRAGRLPSRAEVESYRQGRKVRVKAS